MSFFKEERDNQKKVPQLNLPTPAPSSVNSSLTNTTTKSNFRRFVPPALNRLRLPSNIDFSTFDPSSIIEFQPFDCFMVSWRSIRELCYPSRGTDLHILFREKLTIPTLGVTYLSPDDFLIDAANMKDYYAERCSGIRMLPYVDEHGRNVNWSSFATRNNDVLTISLDASEDDSIKIRFIYRQYRPTPWIKINYPPYIPDFFLVLNLKSEYVMDVMPLTSYGYLLHKVECSSLQSSASCSDIASTTTRTISTLTLQGGMVDLKDSECIICFNSPVDIILYPCGHANLHRKCLEDLEDKNAKFHKQCPTCDQEWSRAINLHPTGQYCFFCEPGTCTKFDTYFLPCECIMGCHKGFKEFAKRVRIKIGHPCPNSACGKPVRALNRFYLPHN